MKNSRRFNLRQFTIRLAFCFLIINVHCETYHGQESPQPARQASLYIHFDERGMGVVSLSIVPEPPSDLPLEQALIEALGVSLKDIQIFTKESIQAHIEDTKARIAKDPQFAADQEYSIEELVDGLDLGYSLTATFSAVGSGSAPDLQINLEALLMAIRPAGIEWLDLTVMHPLTSRAHCKETDWTSSTTQFEIAYHSLRISANEPAQVMVRINRGQVSANDLARLLIPTSLIFLIPIMLTIWMRRRALQLCASDPAVAWFRFFRSQNYIIHATWLAWLAALPALDLSSSLDLLLAGTSTILKQVTDVAFYFVIPAIVAVVCSVLSHSLHSRIRGEEWTRRDLMQQAIWTLAVGSLPFLCLIVGIGLMASNHMRLAIIWMIAGLAIMIVSSKYFWKSQDLEHHSLTVGDLRDRIFALADKAGVKLKQVYILPGGKGRMMNAFAASGNKVMLTHYLLKNLSRREVDAVVAHEIAHLKHNHTSKRSFALIVGFGVCFGLATFLETLAPGFPTYSLCVAACIVAFHHFSRKHEYEADREGIALSGDPEAMVTALTKLSHLSHMPVEWGRFDEAMLTHPSTINRAKAIARATAIDDERLTELMQLPEKEDDGYNLPAAVISDEKIFSTSFKTSIGQKCSWTIIAATIITPALAVWVSMAADWSEPVRFGILLLGLAATIGLVALAINYMPVTGCRKLQSHFLARLEREGVDPKDFDGVFVGLSPAPEQRLYENNYDWDVGYLLFVGDKLFYIGEQTSFALRKNQITNIWLGDGPVCWFRSRRIYVSWSDSETGSKGVFNIHPNDVSCLSELEGRVRAVYEQSRVWMEKRSWPVAPPHQYADLKAPGIGPVTSAAPLDVIGTQQFVASLVIMLVIAFAVAVVFDLSLSLRGGAGWYVPLVTMLVTAFQRVPFWTNDESGSAKIATLPEEQAAH